MPDTPPATRGWYYRALRSAYERAPHLRRAAAAATNGVVRALLTPQVPVPPAARSYTAAELVGLTDHLNERAEAYFASQLSPEFRRFLLGKPFSDVEHFAEHMFSVGVLVHWLQLRPGDVVVELGAGSGWLSQLLNRFGCQTVCLDVSPTAVGLAATLFEADSHTNWALEPRFAHYDGRRLPLDDATADAVVVYDAFHHVPNQAEVLRELRRVVRPGGVVAMSEPGRRHSLSGGSIAEVEQTGVLENDIVVEELDVLARRCGFSRTTVVPLSLAGSMEVDSAELVGFLRGQGFQQYWTRQAQSLLSEHYILLHNGTRRPDTRRPGLTTASIELAPLAVRSDGATVLGATVTNTGDTLWRSGDVADYGTTRLGIQRLAPDGTVLERDWHRVAMPGEVEPGGSVELTTTLPVLAAGRHRLRLDLVAEAVRWFGDHGSPTVEVDLEL